MLKRILFTILTISLLIFGNSTAWAGTLPHSDGGAAEAEQSQTIEGTINVDQKIDTNETAKEEEQAQTTSIKVEQSSYAEEGQAVSGDSNKSGEAEPVQDVTAAEQESDNADAEAASSEQGNTDESTESNAVQTNEESVTAKGEAAESKGDSYSQEQSVVIEAEQSQTVKEAEQVDADQEQDLTLEYKQKLKVTQEEQQSQYQKIETEQDQSISTQDQTDYANQTLTAIIDTKQSGEIDLKADRNSSLQKTKVEMAETHEAETSGNAVMKQEQSVKAKAVSSDTTSEGFSIKAAAENGVEIIKDAAKTIVKVVQSIFVNDKEVDTIEDEFNLEEGAVNKTQEYTKSFDWGTLSVVNSVVVNQTADQDVYSLLQSIIKLDFILPKEKIVDAAASDDSCTNDSDCDGLTDDEERALGTDPFNPDTDGDRLTDYLEVRIYFTNPLNPDSDGDGLSDYFEIYHL
jgi:hypothetical protein